LPITIIGDHFRIFPRSQFYCVPYVFSIALYIGANKTARVDYGFPIVFLWFSYVFSYGYPMVFLWFSYGVPMVSLWFSYGFLLVFLWFPYGFLMVFLMCSY